MKFYQAQNGILEKKDLFQIIIDVSKQVEKKIKAFKCYKQEIQKFPHPRSIVGMETLMKYRGMESGLKFAEAYYLARSIIK